MDKIQWLLLVEHSANIIMNNGLIKPKLCWKLKIYRVTSGLLARLSVNSILKKLSLSCLQLSRCHAAHVHINWNRNLVSHTTINSFPTFEQQWGSCLWLHEWWDCKHSYTSPLQMWLSLTARLDFLWVWGGIKWLLLFSVSTSCRTPKNG